jgi:FkbM family methyltransferase
MGGIVRKKANSSLGRKTILLFLTLGTIISLGAFSLFGDVPSGPSALLSLHDASGRDQQVGVQGAIRKTSGEGWEMWNRQAAMKFDWKCRWGTYHATNGLASPICLHPAPDNLSNGIFLTGRWNECDRLTSLWEHSGDADNEQSVYLEIGGNVGSCVMQMLLTTKAKIVVFEPDPRNQFCLTNTLMAVPREVRERVSLFPIALGSENGSSTINAAEGNMGNSVVGTQIQDDPNQLFHKPIPIRIERLDSILNMNNLGWKVPLLKIDAQGFECRIMDGMGVVVDRMGLIATEIAQTWLIGQGCSDVGYFDRLHAAGFDIFTDSYDVVTGSGELLTKPLNADVYGIAAVKRKRRTNNINV